MKYAAFAALLLLAQDKSPLFWKFKEGQKFNVSWRQAIKTTNPRTPRSPSIMDVQMRMSGVLTIMSAKGGRATGELVLTRYWWKGTQGGRSGELLVEKGEIQRATASMPDGGREYKAELDKPAKFELAASGGYGLTEPHIILNNFFSGQNACFGPTLPDPAVAAGDTWEGKLQSSQVDPPGSITFWMTYHLVSIEKGRAAVRFDETKEHVYQGIPMKLRYRHESTFDIEGGYCAKSRTETDGRVDGDESKHQKYDVRASVDFECTPVKD